MDDPRDGSGYDIGAIGGIRLRLLSLDLGRRSACVGGRGLCVFFLSARISLFGLLSQKVGAAGVIAARAIPSTEANDRSKDRGIDEYPGHWSAGLPLVRGFVRLGK